MDKGSVIQTLRMYEPELRAAGIVHLRLFGSVARGESYAGSDIDLMADFDAPGDSPLSPWPTWKIGSVTCLA